MGCRLIWLLLGFGLLACQTVTPLPAYTPTIVLPPTPTSIITPLSHSCLPPSTQETMYFLALGDSYTIGESVSEAERWPVQLAALLNTNGFKVAPPTIIATTGWTTGQLMSNLARYNNLRDRYDLVSLLIGVNNQYQGRGQEEYREQFGFLLGRAIELAGNDPGRVLVLSIPDWGVTPFANDSGRDSQQIAAEIDAFNAINQEITAAYGVAYLDITPISRQAPADPTLIASDGLHPSAKMYTAWATLAFPVACQALAK